MAPSRSRDVRSMALLAGVVCAATTVFGVVGSPITVRMEEPVTLLAAFAYVAFGTGAVATVSLFLFVGRSLLSPWIVGSGYLAVVYAGFLGAGETESLVVLLSHWPWAFAAALGLGLVEYLIRRGIERWTGRFGPRPLV